MHKIEIGACNLCNDDDLFFWLRFQKTTIRVFIVGTIHNERNHIIKLFFFYTQKKYENTEKEQQKRNFYAKQVKP